MMCNTMLSKMFVVMVVIAAALIGAPAFGLSWDYTNDYSTTENPNGVWSYGRLDASFGSFALDLTILNYETLHIWCDPPTLNPSPGRSFGGPFDFAEGGAYFAADEGFLVSPANDYKADARWEAPVAGVVDISATFKGIQYNTGSNSDVFIIKNGNVAAPLFSTTILGYYGGGAYAAFGSNPVATYTGQVTVALGDTIDFCLSNPGRTGYDRIGFEATITMVPEPSALLVLTGGIGSVAAIARRRRR